MQKKILALAVAGLVSTGAFAQSNVTMYGILDLYYSYGMDNFAADVKDGGMIASGGQSSSRFGFKGSEDLGNGLKVNFKMEGGFTADDGASNQNGRLFGRWATVGLSGNWGEVQVGRRTTFQDDFLGAQDANERSTVAQVSPVYLDQARYNNVIVYLSPVWNGLQGKVGYSTQGTNGDLAWQEQALSPITSTANSAASNTNLRVFTTALEYRNGPLLLGAVYDWNSYADRDSKVEGLSGNYGSGNVWNVGGAYDFGVVRINGVVGAINYANNPQFNEDKDNRKQWSLGVSAPIGKAGKLALTYANAEIKYIADGAKKDEMQMWGLAYFHNLSKRTNFYAAFGSLDQDDTFYNKKNKVGLDSQNGYQESVQFGLRHQF